MSTNYKVAIIGGGAIAEAHLKALREVEQVKVVAIAEKNESRLSYLTENYESITFYTDYGELLEREHLDIAIITLPHYLHCESAIRAAEAGCHIILEKPMALHTQQCDAIIETARRKRVQVLVGHTQHFFAENRAVKKVVDSQELGQLVMITDTRHVDYYKSSRPDWFLQKELSGGGILTNLGSHSVDKLLWFTGSPIVAVKAQMTFLGDRGDVEGSGIVMLEHENGLCTTIAQSGYKGSSNHITELSFTAGRIRLQTGVGAWISRGDADYEPLPTEKLAAPLALQVYDLIESIETGREPLCTMEYSRSIVEVVEAMYRSHENRREVRL
ncbi:Gfo/Idh/MocA family protein [Paenibacillus chungangensis]|uniref:Gfo/Idh/MocA family protein n=1 Tax=Paenibacillus chungangensis TaxID=696535 RepID=A0ABW3HSZ5_9BACL